MTNSNNTSTPPFVGALQEQNDPKYDHIRKALELYVKVIDALNTTDEREKEEVTFNCYQSPEDKKAGEKVETQTMKFDTLVNTRMMRVFHHMNETFYDPNDGATIMKADPQWLQTFDEVKKMFHGVTKDGKPAGWQSFKEGNNGAADGMSAYDYTQQLWSLPPELLEPTIAICIARDFLCHRKALLVPGYGIKVRGNTVHPWKGFASRYNALILDA